MSCSRTQHSDSGEEPQTSNPLNPSLTTPCQLRHWAWHKINSKTQPLTVGGNHVLFKNFTRNIKHMGLDSRKPVSLCRTPRRQVFSRQGQYITSVHNIGITHVFSCSNICRVPRKLFEHEVVRLFLHRISLNKMVPASNFTTS